MSKDGRPVNGAEIVAIDLVLQRLQPHPELVDAIVVPVDGECVQDALSVQWIGAIGGNLFVRQIVTQLFQIAFDCGTHEQVISGCSDCLGLPHL